MMNLDFDNISIAILLLTIGIFIGVMFEKTTYTNLLKLLAEVGACEKIGDAFYYIVPEKKYVEINRFHPPPFSPERIDLLALRDELQRMIDGCKPCHPVPSSAVMKKLLIDAHAVVLAHAKCNI